MQLQDGQGTGSLARVDNEGHLHTNALINEHLSWHSVEKGKSFAAYCRHNTAVVDTDENVAYIKYTGTGHLVLEKIIISAKLTTGIGKVEGFFSPTSVSSDDTVTALNLNRASNNSSDTTIYQASDADDLTGTVASANEVICIRLSVENPTYVVELDGGIVLGPQDDFLLLAETATVGDKIRVTFYYYEE